MTATTAAAGTPEQATRALADSVSRGDLDAAASCFAKDACFVTPDATTVRGRDAIRQILRQMIMAGSHIEVEESSMLVAGEIAFGTERWLLTSPGSECKPFTRSLAPMLVLGRLEGVWKLAVALPW